MDDSAAYSRNSSALTADTDDLIVGDRVWVNGKKPGYVQFIGETKFAKGEWAGIVLDSYNGKNDGTINGVRYFQCEPFRGLFCRLYRLSRYPVDTNGDRLYSFDNKDKSKLTRTVRSQSPDGKIRSTTTEYVNKPVPHYALPTRGPAKLVTEVTTMTTSDDPNNNIRIGDRVVVNTKETGVQSGRVRYIGRTQFSSGIWVGLELNEPNGKNDGSVAGRRYFICPKRYGLFAPIDKVVKGEAVRTITKTRFLNTTTSTTDKPVWKSTRFQTNY
ncbi:CAP-Gly domain-containing linker protein 2-like [Oppia nitens]|uniref:CAP-Gly domain-containing linker protein 2-like n=1 Tax=Oppia nitens TaxID=1686743 RepID=UPI0023DC4C24|nr:CAP-Gly domain-containing linker protein 2-like [Oppia nitens]